MRWLKHIRVVVSVVFLLECVLAVTWGVVGSQPTAVARGVQIVPSALTASALATGVWLLATLLLGRVYCSSVCPLGTLQDIVIRVRRTVKPQRFSYKPAGKGRYVLLGAYVVCMVAGAGVAAVLMEPWPLFANMVSSLGGMGVSVEVASLITNALTGVVCGVVSVVALLVYALLRGRDFCNEVCPVGTVLGFVGAKAVLHIELDPDKCTSCLKCEDVCKASCIKVSERRVDNSRCVRCFNCVQACPCDAIRYQYNRNNVVTPLMRRVPRVTNIKR